MATQTNRDRNSGAYVGAALLIVFGLAALAANLGGSQLVWEAIPFGIGMAFLVAYVLTRQYGFLVPGGILAGVGGGVLASSILNVKDAGPYAVIGMALGFLAIYLVDIVATGSAARWWPAIPGGIMLLVGVDIASGNDAFVRTLQLGVPLALIAVGVLILVTRIGRAPR